MTKHNELGQDFKTQAAGNPEAADTPELGHDSGAKKIMTNAVSVTENIGSGMVGSVATVATDLVHGVGDLSEEVVIVVRDTANTAITGIGSVGGTALHTLTGLLSELVGGVREIGATAWRGKAPTTEARFIESGTEPSRTSRTGTKETGWEEAMY